MGFVGYAETERLSFFGKIRMGLELRRALRQMTNQTRKPLRPSWLETASADELDGIAIEGTGRTIGGFVPVGFEAYAWLSNPAWKTVTAEVEGAVLQNSYGEDADKVWSMPVSWATVAEAGGRTMDKDTRWGEICGPCDESAFALDIAGAPGMAWTWGPREGTIEPVTSKLLFNLLAATTGPEDRCLVGQWDGGSRWNTDVKLETGYWNYFVGASRFGDLGEFLWGPDTFERSENIPHVVWPADRQWFLATLYSGFSSYVAGSRELIYAVLESELEAYEVDLSDAAR